MNWTSRTRIPARSGAVLLLLAAACSEEPAGGPALRTAVASGAATGGACSPTNAHPRHAFTSCQTCHVCKGVVQFDPAGPAISASLPPPSFDGAAQSCSNVACHTVAPGTFSYWFQDGTGEAELKTVSYGGTSSPTPAWSSSGLGCSACHGNPPRNGNWHSGRHAAQGPSGAANQCQFCHPDASGLNGVGTTITNPSLHANGAVDVQAYFKRTCFYCH